MINDPNRPFDELSELNLRMRIHLEQAEMIVPPLNQQIDQLARLSWLAPTAFLSDIVASRPYATGSDQHDSCQIVRGALLVPGGFGVVVVDLEDHLIWQMQAKIAFCEVNNQFLPFKDCSPAERAFLFPQVESLLRLLQESLLPASRSFDPRRFTDDRAAGSSPA